MMQIIDTLLGCSASSRHVGSAHRVDGAMGSRTEEVQLESGSACGWRSAPYPPYVQIWPGGNGGLETHLTFLVGVLVPHGVALLSWERGSRD